MKMTRMASREPVPPAPGTSRPRWSVMIPTYQSSAFLEETIRSVLAQDPGPAEMQIEVVDDGSDDDPETLVRDVGQGRVAIFRQPRNLGHIANFQTCLARARGEIVHLLHGDDSVRPGFYQALQAGFDTDPSIGAAFCRSIYVDQAGQTVGMVPKEREVAGVLEDGLARLATEQKIMTPSIAVRRTVYERLGGFDRRLACAEDWEMWVRIAAHYPIWYEPRALAVYRMHDASNTGRHVRSAEDARYNRIAIDIFSKYLPADRAHEITGRARRLYAESALETARALLRSGDYLGCALQAREAVRLAPSARILAKAALLPLTARRTDVVKSEPS
jgi:glycosyltransferase involved in cell wall biosynthesis